MKTSSPVHQYILLLFFMAGIALFSCNQPAKNNMAQNAPKVLKKVDKQTLLNMVADVAKTMSKKGSKSTDGITLLKTYAQTYDLVINGVPKHKADTGYVYVNITGDEKITWFVFGLPQLLQREISFTDLKNSYGEWTLSPVPESPVSIGSSFHLKDAPGVWINVESKNLPEAKQNLIENIAVMRLTHE